MRLIIPHSVPLC
ncbi:hypothetical protein YPPY94_0873, partial [Yersinia pestis PY-94]